MFGINRLLSKDSDLDAQEQYTKVSSLIEEGSTLDRRKSADDRRISIERRVRLRQAFAGLEKRVTENRRTAASRRHLEESLEKSESHANDDEEVIRLSDAEILVRDQNEIIKNVAELISTAKLNEFDGVKEKIRDIAFRIKSITLEEEKHLYLSFDKNVKKANEDTEKSLTEILFYIHDVSDQVLEYLDRYYYTGITEASVGFFLLDMNIVYESLNKSLSKKQKHLYPMYG